MITSQFFSVKNIKIVTGAFPHATMSTKRINLKKILLTFLVVNDIYTLKPILIQIKKHSM